MDQRDVDMAYALWEHGRWSERRRAHGRSAGWLSISKASNVSNASNASSSVRIDPDRCTPRGDVSASLRWTAEGACRLEVDEVPRSGGRGLVLDLVLGLGA